jgi:hypothetical protein
MGVLPLGCLALQSCLLIPKRLIVDSGIDICVDSTTGERRYLVQSLAYTIESETNRNMWLCPFGSLAKNPLANIAWAVNQYDAPVLALTQELNNLNIDKSDLIQVHEYANAVIVYLRPYVADIDRLNSTTEPQGCSVSVRVLFNPQHWQLPLYQLFIGCWIRKSAFLSYPSVHDECHRHAIGEKRGILFLDDAFSTNGENSTNCLARANGG